MTQLAAWLAVCLGVAWFFRSRPVHALALVVLLWTALPAVAGYRLTGQTTGSFAFHPATWLVLAIFVMQLTLRPAKLAAAVSRHALLFVVVAIFTIGAFLTSRVGNSGGTRLMFDQIIGPFLLFWLVVAFAHEDRRVGLVLRNAIIFAAAAESVLAIIQKGIGSIIFYLDDYSRLYWFNPETFERWMGTTDSPLVFSLAVCIAGALTLGLKNWVLAVHTAVLVPDRHAHHPVAHRDCADVRDHPVLDPAEPHGRLGPGADCAGGGRHGLLHCDVNPGVGPHRAPDQRHRIGGRPDPRPALRLRELERLPGDRLRADVELCDRTGLGAADQPRELIPDVRGRRRTHPGHRVLRRADRPARPLRAAAGLSRCDVRCCCRRSSPALVQRCGGDQPRGHLHLGHAWP